MGRCFCQSLSQLQRCLSEVEEGKEGVAEEHDTQSASSNRCTYMCAYVHVHVYT